MLPRSAHTDRPWRIHALTPDFRIYDVWALPTPGGPEDFGLLVEQFLDGDTASNPSRIARALFAIRWRLGEWFGWDDPERTPVASGTSLRQRLPEDLRSTAVPDPTRLPFTSVYLTGNEWAAEMANRTCHAVLHLGWVADEQAPDGFRGQMAVLVRFNGFWGRLYMALIGPFRHLLVYPPLMRGIGARWAERRKAA
jgi:hypothetical protein